VRGGGRGGTYGFPGESLLEPCARFPRGNAGEAGKARRGQVRRRARPRTAARLYDRRILRRLRPAFLARQALERSALRSGAAAVRRRLGVRFGARDTEPGT